jgi:hypothetical protein
MAYRLNNRHETVDTPELIAFVYELLDAHDETSQLAAGLADGDSDWAMHMRYLRDLQREGRALLARAPVPHTEH